MADRLSAEDRDNHLSQVEIREPHVAALLRDLYTGERGDGENPAASSLTPEEEERHRVQPREERPLRADGTSVEPRRSDGERPSHEPVDPPDDYDATSTEEEDAPESERH